MPVRLSMRSLLSCSFLLAALFFSAGSLSGNDRNQQRAARPITVLDAIEMTRLGLPDSQLNTPVRRGFAQYSPDGRRFVILLKRGEIRKNTNDYSVLLYRTADVFHSPRPDILLTISSASNREAIKSVKWLDDNDTVTFIGEREGGPPQVYEFCIGARRLMKLTDHDTPVVAYDVSAEGKTVLFEADPLPQDSRELPSEGQEIVATHDITHVLLHLCGPFRPTTTQGEDLFLKKQGEPERHVPVPGAVFSELLPPSLSPDGHYGLVGVFLRTIPVPWSEYDVPWLRDAVKEPRGPGEVSLTVAQYMLLNTATRVLRPLLDAPLSWPNVGLAWTPDSKSVVLSGTFLPLAGHGNQSADEHAASQTSAVEVNLVRKSFTTITKGPFRVERWDSASRNVIFLKWGGAASEEQAFEKTGDLWKPAPLSSTERQGSAAPEITLEQDSNSPPRVFASDAGKAEESLLLDLNPQFSELEFGRVKTVTWKATDGHEVSGGLFFPPHYEPGRRYPLVIQTHGYYPDKFYMDGPWSSAFAARPLAAHGIFVLQVGYSVKDDDARFENTPAEGARQMAVYQGAIDYLDGRSLIDRSRVGIIGFSRTVYTVGFTLTHSHYSFAAATLADGMTGGYFDYMALPYLSNPPLLNGGLPFGPSLASWVKNAPNFRLDKVGTPVRVEAYGPASLLGMWEWYSGLSMLKKPVELIYLPGAPHLLRRPSDRLSSQQGNVDWFCFWLKDETVAKSVEEKQEFKRWEHFRKMGIGSD